MRAIEFSEYGSPEVLHVAEREAPKPRRGQVQIKVAAAGTNPADYKWRSGFLSSMVKLALPYVTGYDVAGTVSDVGPDVTGLKVGDRVVASVYNGYAEFAVADEKACAVLPDDFDFIQAAALPCPALTGVQALEVGVAPRKGNVILVTGATGGVGQWAVHAALKKGCQVIAAVRQDYFMPAMMLGAFPVIQLGAEPTDDLPKFNAVVDTVGGPLVAKLCRHVAPGGKIVCISNDPVDPEGLPVTPQGFNYDPVDGERLSRIVAAVASGAVKVPVAHCLPFDRAAEAHRLLESGAVGGRIVLTP